MHGTGVLLASLIFFFLFCGDILVFCIWGVLGSYHSVLMIFLDK